MDSKLQNNSLPKIFDETCKFQKNARMIVEQVFSFPDKYFTKGWFDDKRSEDSGGQVINKNNLRPTLFKIIVLWR